MQTHKKLKARILSLALSATMVTTLMPMNVFTAEGGTVLGASSVGEIQSFNKLEDRFIPSMDKDAPDHIYGLTVELDTPEEDLRLPTELTAMVARTTVTDPDEDEPVVDSGKEDAPAEDETIPDEDKVVEDDTSTDDTVSGNQPASPSDAKEEVKAEIKDSNIPLAPEPEDGETVVTTVEQETIPVTWESNREYVPGATGTFLFTSRLPEGYTLADGLKAPQIYVLAGNPIQTRALTPTEVSTAEELKATFADAAEGDTIQIRLTEDINLGSETLTPNGKAFTIILDLNGNTLSSSKGVFKVTGKTSLTITDNSGTKGTVTTPGTESASGSAIYYSSSGHLSVQSAIISGGTSYAIYADVYLLLSEVTISESTLTNQSTYSTIYCRDIEASISNSTVSNTHDTSKALEVAGISVVTVHDTTLTSSGVGTVLNACSGDGSLTLSGNTKLTSSHPATYYGTLYLNNESSTFIEDTVEIANTNSNGYALFMTNGCKYTLAPTATVGKIGPATKVKGTITDAVTGKPISKASLQLKNSTGAAIGDPVVSASDGKYTAIGYPGTGFTIEVSAAKHATGTISAFDIGYDDDVTGKDLALSPKSQVDYTGPEANEPDSTPASKTDTQIVLKPVTAPSGEAIEYAKSTSNAAPTSDSDWQDSTDFTGLTADTQYYFFARVKANDSHKAGTASTGTAIKTDKSDAQKVAAAKILADAAVTSLTATNATTAAGILSTVNTAIASVTGVTATWKSAPTITTATDSAAGSITGTMVLTCGTTTVEVTVNKTISQLGSDAEKVANAKAAAVAALNSYTATNVTADSDIMALVNKAITDAGITDVTAAWKSGSGFDKINATASTTGSVTGIITLKLNSAEQDVVVNLTIAQLVDKAALTTAITAANNAKSGITVSDNAASSVTRGTKFVTTAEMKALTDAIEAAQAVANNPASTADQVSAAITTLNNAVSTFNAAIKTGTYSGGGGGGSSSGQAIWTSTPPKYQGGTKLIGNVRVPDYTVEGSWKKNENGTWTFAGNGGQTYVNTWAPIFNPYADVTKGQSAFDWFMFDASGNMMTGWYTDVNGNTYYLNPNSDNTLGAMRTGWVLIDGKYYYFDEMPDGTRGKLFRNTRTPEGYLVDENGVWDGSEKQ